MTENKRFTFDVVRDEEGYEIEGFEIVDLDDEAYYGMDTTENCVRELVKLLNELHEENEQLKRKNKFLKNQYERKDRQLHRTKKDIEKYTDYFMNELNWDCDRIIREVFK